MNEKLSQLRQRLKGSTERKARWSKDIITVPVSLLALAISSFTLFYGTIRQRELVEATSVEMPRLKFEDKVLKPLGQAKFVFINRGTMGIAIAGGAVHFYQANDAYSKECFEKVEHGTTERALSTEPFVIKAGDAVIAALTINTEPITPVIPTDEAEDTIFVHACMMFYVAASGGMSMSHHYLGVWGFPISGRSNEPITDDDYPSGMDPTPYRLIDRSGTIFSTIQ